MPLISAGEKGPIPFKDVVVVDGNGVTVEHQPLAAQECSDVIATLPSKIPTSIMSRMRLYRSAWFPEKWIPGIMALERRFKARAGDVVLASLPKCGTTWLKALAFATMARGKYPPAGGDGGCHHHHPLLRLNPHDCVPFLESIYFNEDEEAKLNATPSPRLLSTHLPYSSLPTSVTDSPHCKIIYNYRQPKDMLISFGHFINGDKSHNVPLSCVWESVHKCTCLGSPIWEHILNYWIVSKATPDSVMFLRYEEMLRDPTRNVEKIAEFIGKPFSHTEKEVGIVA